MITIQVNNTTHSFNSSSTLQDLLAQLGISPKGVAVAVNDHIISKKDWSHHQLAEGEHVLIIEATQGG